MQNERHPSAEEQFTTITGLIAWDASNIHLCDSPEVKEQFTTIAGLIAWDASNILAYDSLSSDRQVVIKYPSSTGIAT